MNESPGYVTLEVEGKAIKLPVVVGSEGEKAIDIAGLRRQTGYVTLDPSFMNTAACYSQITFVDGERGILRYRGIPIEELVRKTMFVEVAYLLVHGELPSEEQRRNFSTMLNLNSMLHEDMRHFFDHFPRGAHPMHILSTMINALAAFYPNVDLKSMEDDIDVSTARLISIVRTMAAFAYKKSIGEPVVYPRHDLSYCANFLNMMFDSPVRPYQIHPEAVRILNILFILHADHEQNCSTTAVRAIGSAQVNLYATISAGISALSGPLHGGANQAVIEMLQMIHADGDVKKFIRLAKDRNNPFRLMGFGHRVYKTYDPRAAIIKKECDAYLERIHYKDPLLDVAREVEEAALTDPYFVERNLYPNVDFYTGILYRALGIPENMFTVMFALARLPGWVAHWKEMIGGETKIVRPRQIYIGKTPAETAGVMESRELLIR
ncbi:citrate synthase [Victivallis vadensis]|jgi:citrate (Si)-synthase|uniref:Citrate synthase n=1 Tax=Victivallis vadensis TaxID=172901 RepID=A0A2U1BA77_9BACT|nr:citrate synthase [Victivallis vadensis]NMD87472.1 citrate synthase [Victivallis vadensis]PVY45532.1 citrate synthase [Victivallis vadensis]PWM74630.1 MAG: citrate (Si)-synthase [Lentisphaerota bacterium]HJH05019.1 citrate synthase [Victivallis vadensis]